jgi:hypothetical protein
VSVIRYLGPTGPAGTLAQTRQVALTKLRPLLRTLGEGAGRDPLAVLLDARLRICTRNNRAD